MSDDATGELSRTELVLLERLASREVERRRRRHEQHGSAESQAALVALAQLETKLFRLRLARDREGGEDV